MATPDNNDTIATDPNPNPNPEEQEQEHDSDPSFSGDEDALIEKLDNVVLKSDESRDADDEKDDDNGGLDCTGLLALRPYAGDCPHYLRNGTCKFGLTCRFSHPVKKTHQIVKGEDSVSDSSGTMECKYFSTAGGCKYGKSCRYSHPGEESENTVSELNFLGLPMRLGEKECEYYMRNGSCGYGSRCVYHHPDPISKESPNAMDGKFRRQVAPLSENRKGDSLHLLRASRPYQVPWSLHKSSDTGGPYSENYSYPQWMGKQSDRNEYQAPSYPRQSRNFYPSPTANDSMRNTDVYVQLDEFPERPGAPECDYFMKTGNCKFKSTCRFHHPKNRMPKPDECVLSEKGLPLRPGKGICRHFERLGLCKFGPACLFDHPVSLGLTYPNWPARGTAIASNDESWED